MVAICAPALIWATVQGVSSVQFAWFFTRSNKALRMSELAMSAPKSSPRRGLAKHKA